MSELKIQIRDIEGLNLDFQNIQSLVNKLVDGPFIFSSATCYNDFSVGYFGQNNTSYALDINGNVFISQNQVLNGQLHVDKETFLNSSIQIEGNAILKKSLDVTGVTNLKKNLNVLENASIGSNLYINGSSLFQNNVSVLGKTYLDQTLDVKGKVRLGYNVITPNDGNHANPFGNYSLDVSGSCYINEDITVYKNMSVNGTTYMNGMLTLKNDLTSYSDRRIKKNIFKLENCLDKITNIRGYTFQRIDLGDKQMIGLIAQELEGPFPELVTEINDLKTVNYTAFTGVLLECIQELKEKITILENKILK